MLPGFKGMRGPEAFIVTEARRVVVVVVVVVGGRKEGEGVKKALVVRLRRVRRRRRRVEVMAVYCVYVCVWVNVRWWMMIFHVPS
jgi:hypothetical protein